MNMHGWITSEDLLGPFLLRMADERRMESADGVFWKKRNTEEDVGHGNRIVLLCWRQPRWSSIGSFWASVAGVWMWWIVYNREFGVNEIRRNTQTWHKYHHLGCDISPSSQLHSWCDFAKFHWVRGRELCILLPCVKRSAFYRSAIILYQWLVSWARGWIRGPCLSKKQSRAPNFSNFILLIHDIVIITTLPAFLYTRNHRQSFGSIESLVYVSKKSLYSISRFTISLEVSLFIHSYLEIHKSSITLRIISELNQTFQSLRPLRSPLNAT
jgi:hypothetical protein